MFKNNTSLQFVVAVLAIIGGLVFIGLAVSRISVATPEASIPGQCSIQESKPVLIVSINGNGANALCQKIIQKSNNRYFAYYGSPSFDYTRMCSVTIKKTLQYTVYDVIPLNVDPKTRYSYTSVCTLLQQHHRLIGEGF